MSIRHNISIAFLIVLGMVVVLFFGLEIVKEQSRRTAGTNPYEGVTRPVRYPESPSEGDERATLVVYEFGDFTCPTCRDAQPAMERLYATYGNRILHVWKDFPFLSDESTRAAVAARCAGEQGAFWDYHEWLFDNQAKLGSVSYDAGAKEVGIDAADFGACIEAGNYADEVERDFLEGQALGIDATPTFVIGNIAFAGPVTYEDMERVVKLQMGE